MNNSALQDVNAVVSEAEQVGERPSAGVGGAEHLRADENGRAQDGRAHSSK